MESAPLSEEMLGMTSHFEKIMRFLKCFLKRKKCLDEFDLLNFTLYNYAYIILIDTTNKEIFASKNEGKIFISFIKLILLE